jgi:predicted HTH transcriptional regulator
MPRNVKITEWFRSLRDDRGAEFVRMLSEGTRRMRDEMAGLSLPPPEYRNGPVSTTVLLKSRSKEREARLRVSAGAQEKSTEIANAFEISAETAGSPVADLGDRRGEILTLLGDGLQAHEWYVDSIH